MNLSFPFAGYLLMVLIIMFGGRKRRSFSQAFQAAAGVTITLLCMGAILWLLGVAISQMVNVKN
jgi:galactitol-specific phosphotransferase system IIC component